MPTFLPAKFIFTESKIVKTDPIFTESGGQIFIEYLYIALAAIIFFYVASLIVRRMDYNAAMRKEKKKNAANKAITKTSKTPAKRHKYLTNEKHLPLYVTLGGTLIVLLGFSIFRVHQRIVADDTTEYQLMPQSNLITRPSGYKHNTTYGTVYDRYTQADLVNKKVNYYVYVKQHHKLTYLGNIQHGYLTDYQENTSSRAFAKINRYINEHDLDHLFQKQLQFTYTAKQASLSSNKAKLSMITHDNDQTEIKLQPK